MEDHSALDSFIFFKGPPAQPMSTTIDALLQCSPAPAVICLDEERAADTDDINGLLQYMSEHALEITDLHLKGVLWSLDSMWEVIDWADSVGIHVWVNDDYVLQLVDHDPEAALSFLDVPMLPFQQCVCGEDRRMEKRYVDL